jgi:branched-subunit amino acid aminotransferase/4-amino-4-deoxychorismate lyase
MPPEPIAFHNGRFVPPGELALSFADAGFVSGVTVTDFCRTYRHRLFRWPDHLARLRRDCAACHVPLPYPDAELTAAAEHLAAHNAQLLSESEDLALVTFATPGPLGYMTGSADDGPPTIGMHTFPLPVARYRRFFTEGVVLEKAGWLPDFLVGGVKHRSRLHWWLAERKRTVRGAVPVLSTGSVGADTAIGCLLIVRHDAVVWSRSGDVLESVSLGVVRELCQQLGIRFVEKGLDLNSCNDVTEMMLAGSGFGLAGVRRLIGPISGDREFTPWPGPVTVKLQAAWSDLVGMDMVRQMTVP